MGLRKASAERFDQGVLDLVKELGVGTGICGGRQWVKTKAGEMGLQPNTRWFRGRGLGLFTVFCQFDDVVEARALLGSHSGNGLNPHSGKFNFHMTGDNDDVDDALNAFKSHLQRVL